MKPLPFVLAVSLLASVPAFSQLQIVTLTVGKTNSTGYKIEARLDVAANQAATVVGQAGSGGYPPSFIVQRGNPLATTSIWPGDNGGAKLGKVIAGPATIIVSAYRHPPGSDILIENGFVSLALSGQSCGPDKSVVVPQGEGALIRLQSSTNLLDWVDASPGFFSNTNGLSQQFLRLVGTPYP